MTQPHVNIRKAPPQFKCVKPYRVIIRKIRIRTTKDSSKFIFFYLCILFLKARILSARKLLQNISKEKREIVSGMERLCDAYIESAYVSVLHLKSKTGEGLFIIFYQYKY